MTGVFLFFEGRLFTQCQCKKNQCSVNEKDRKQYCKYCSVYALCLRNCHINNYQRSLNICLHGAVVVH